MGKKLATLDQKVGLSFQESMAKLQSRTHVDDLYESGYAAALADVRRLIASLNDVSTAAHGVSA
jgi:hypothetical protein